MTNADEVTAEDRANAERLHVQSEAFASQFLALVDGGNLGIVVASAISAAVAVAMAAGLKRQDLESLFEAVLNEVEEAAKE